MLRQAEITLRTLCTECSRVGSVVYDPLQPLLCVQSEYMGIIQNRLIEM